MSRMSEAALRAALSQQTSEVLLALLELSHPSWSQPIRVTSDGVNTRHQNNDYANFPFVVAFPEAGTAGVPVVKLQICNVDRSIVQSVRQARATSVPIAVKLSAVLASTPDVVEAGPYRFKLTEVTHDAVVVEGTLSMEDLINAPFPAHRYTPGSHPGVFS